MRGPPPKPTALKIAEGNPGKRRINTSEPKPRLGEPSPPDWLDDYARTVWRETVAELTRLGVLTIVDGQQLASYCQAASRERTAEKIIKKKGLIFFTPNGFVQKRPEVTIAREAAELKRKLATEFGLTPASRSRLHVLGDTEDDDEQFLVQ